MEAGRRAVEVERVLSAARRCGVEVVLSNATDESAAEFAARLGGLDVQRVRVLGPVGAALRTAGRAAEIHQATDPVTSVGRIELLHYLREQTLSRTMHRYGNLL